MKQLLTISFLIFAMAGTASAQEEDLSRLGKGKLKKEGNLHFWDANFIRAIPYYEELIKKDPDNLQALYRLGISYLRAGENYSRALKYLQEALQEIESKNRQYQYPEAALYVGSAYHQLHRFDSAIYFYQKYIEEQDLLQEEEKRAVRLTEMAESGKELIAAPADVIIENLRTSINTEYPEYSPVLPQDESYIIFTSRREGNIGGKKNQYGQQDKYGDYYEDIYLAERAGQGWKPAGKISGDINTPGHEASIGLSPDGKKLFIYYNDAVKFGDIYISEKTAEGWSRPGKLPEPINSDYWEGSISLTEDGKTVFFSSNRPGGLGGKDIYKATKLPDGKWSAPENLGEPVNTPYDEDSPFILPDGEMLYFSSTGHNSMGGYDIFSAEKEGAEWQPPQNLGYPINTADDDLYFVFTTTDRRGYFSSAREGGRGSQDIYMAYFPKEIETMPVLIATVRETTHITTVLSNSEIDEICAQAKNYPELQVIVAPYHDSMAQLATDEVLKKRAKGVFQKLKQCAPPQARIELREEIFASTEDALAAFFPKEEKDTIIKEPADTLADLKPHIIYFDLAQFALSAEAEKILDKTATYLRQNPSAKAEIAGYTDNIGSPASNIQLSQKRAEAVREYLAAKGISAERLKISSHGEKNPAAPNETPEGRAANRRVEVLIF